MGYSVSIDGDTALVGAVGDDDKGSFSGSVYVYGRNGTTWTEQDKLTASDGAPADQFGRSVLLDGGTALVGALGDDDAGSISGSAYVLVRSGTSWTEQGKLTASDGAPADFLAWSASIDGDTALVGAPFADPKGDRSGSAYVFVRDGAGTWTQQAKLIASDGAPFDFFGLSVSIDGDTAVLGARQDDDKGINSGSAYVFVRSGTTWTLQTKLTASDAAAFDQFGFSVSIDGDTALVGAQFGDSNVSNSGSAYVFRRTGTTWSEEAKLTASDAAAGDTFGYSVSTDGDSALVGARLDDDDGSQSGSAYVFLRSGTTWTEEAKLTAFDGTAIDRFGHSVSARAPPW